MKKTLLLSLLACLCALSKATVITFQPNNYSFDWQTPYFYIDLNRDGFNDFLMTAEASVGVNTSWFKIKSLTAGTKILTDGTGKVNGLNDSVLISSQIPANLWADSAWVYRWDGNPYPFPLNIYTNMAFRFSDGTNDHYGYINGECYEDLGQGFYDYSIFRIGYESTANAPIKANSETSIVAAPEPNMPTFTMAQFRDHIHLDFDRQMDATIEVRDIQGRSWSTKAIQGTVCDLETSALSGGVYFLQIVSRRNQGQVTLTRKFALLTQD